MIDFEELERDGQELPSDDKLRLIADLVEEYKTKWHALIAADKAVEDLEAEIKGLVTKRLPEALTAAGTAEHKSLDGSTVGCKVVVFANISKERKPAAHAWLRDNNSGALIKAEVKAAFGRGEDENAQRVKEILTREGVEFETTEAVNWQTLQAWAAEQVKKGTDIPRDLFGIYDETVATVEPAIKLPKRKVKK